MGRKGKKSKKLEKVPHHCICILANSKVKVSINPHSNQSHKLLKPLKQAQFTFAFRLEPYSVPLIVAVPTVSRFLIHHTVRQSPRCPSTHIHTLHPDERAIMF